MTRYDRYQELKKTLLNQSIQGYPLDRILGSYLAVYVWLPPISKLRFLISLLRKRQSLKNGAYRNLITFYEGVRGDYDQIIEFHRDKMNPSKTDVVVISSALRSPIGYAKFFGRVLRELLQSRSRNLAERLLLSYLKAFAFVTIENLESQHLTCSVYLSFNSSYLFESFLTYYFRKRSVPTKSIQHAMYFEYLNERPLDILNYENICADQLLCWGEFSLEQLSEKVPPDVHLVIDAYPRTISLERKKIRSDCVLLLLPRWIYAREIKSLLSQIKSSPFDFSIRPHPGSIRRVTNLISNYKNASIESAGNLTECLSKTEYRFCVGFNSSAIFEALIHQGSVFQYLCGNDEFIIPEISSIRNLSDLSLKRVRSISPERLSYYFRTNNPLT